MLTSMMFTSSSLVESSTGAIVAAVARHTTTIALHITTPRTNGGREGEA